MEQEYKHALLDIYDTVEKTFEKTKSYDHFPTEIERREFFGYHQAIMHMKWMLSSRLRELKLKD